MRLDALIPLIGAIVNMALAIFVFIQNPRSTVGRVYFLLGTGFAVWNFGTFHMFIVHEHDKALFWARFLNFGVLWIPITIFHLSFLIAGFKIPRWVVIVAYTLQILLTLSNFTPWLVADVQKVDYAYYTKGGPLYWFLFFIFSLAWLSVVILWRHRKTQPPLVRRRLTPLIVAQASIAFFGSNDALPILGYTHYPLIGKQVYPFGSMAVILYGLIVGYSVLQHQLLNVHVVLGQYVAHLVRLAFIFLIGFCLLLAATLLGHLGMEGFLEALAVLVVTAVIASFVFPRLLGGPSDDLDRNLSGDRFEYQDQVRSFINSMTEYTEMPRLQEDLHHLLVRTFRLESYRLLVREEVTNSVILLQSQPEEPSRPLPEFEADSPVFQCFAEGRRDYLSLSRDHLRLSPSVLERQARMQLEQFESEFCFPLAYQDEPLGLLLVGRKASHEPFTATDVRLLSALARTLSGVVNQIRLKTQISQQQELDLLGRMSRGMAHDLNNLLTPLSTLLQLSAETGELNEELLPVATRNLETMRAYIREALFFSEHLRPDLQLTNLDGVVRQAIEVARNSRKKHVRFVTQFREPLDAEIDSVLVQRLLANLLTNAIDASYPHGEVVVSLQRLARIDAQRDWLRVSIADRGEGISRENLNRIFTPYYTTKDRGDRERGFGLGLAICRKIAALHGGNLSIDSQLRRGTTVLLDLPSRRAQPELQPAMPLAISTAA